MADRPDGNDPWRFAFWSLRERRTSGTHAHPDEPAKAGGTTRILVIALDIALVLAWIALIALIVFYPSEAPNTLSGSYN